MASMSDDVQVTIAALEQENFHLKDEVDMLMKENTELREWQERARKHLSWIGPKRREAENQLALARQLHEKLQKQKQGLDMRQHLKTRNDEMEDEIFDLKEKVDKLQVEVGRKTEANEIANGHIQLIETRLRLLAEVFTQHLDGLIAIREYTERFDTKLDTTADVHPLEKLKTQSSPGLTPDSVEAFKRESRLVQADERSDARPDTSAEMMLSGFDAVSSSCLRWLQDNFFNSDRREHALALRLEECEQQVGRLQDKVRKLTQDAENAFMGHLAQVAELKHGKEYAERKLHDAKAKVTKLREWHSNTSQLIPALVKEAQEYLGVVHTVIRRKFGYVPDSIANTQSWERLIEALSKLQSHKI